MFISLNVFASKVTMYFKVAPISAKSVEVKALTPKCVSGANCKGETIVRLTYGLAGCVDEASVSYIRESTAEGKLKVYVSALNLYNPDSARVKCFKQAERVAEIVISGIAVPKEDVEVIELKQDVELKKL